MSSLSGKSAAELTKLLDEYGIKHGPIVDSTRKLYEKKLTEAMAKGSKPSSDKTYYREEQEEVTYVTYRPPVRHESYGEVTRRSRPEYDDDEADHADEPIISRSHTSYQSTPRSRPAVFTSRSSPQVTASSVPVKTEVSKSGSVPGWLRVLVFIVVAVFLYYIYSNMESGDQSPFGKITA